MATAKQIAARKRFAEMAKSGKLATMRKKAAKKSPRESAPHIGYEEYKQARDDGTPVADLRKFSETPKHEKRYREEWLKEMSKAAPKRTKNPAPKNKVQTKRGGCNPDYLVQIKKGRQWVTVGSHGSQVSAEEAAQALHKSGMTVPIRVWG